MKKILIVTDSLALPRILPEICDYEKTWPYLIKQKGYDVNQISLGGATSTELLKQINYYESYKPDIVILQFGIVDCAPRFLSKNELFVTEILGYIGKGIRFLLNRKVLRKLRKINYVPIMEFHENILMFKKKFNGRIFFIGIIPGSKEYDDILPGVTENIKLYNELLSKEFKNFISLEEILQIGVMSDFHHLNETGHNYIFSKLMTIL